MAKDLYKILNLDKTATAADVRKAYRSLAKKFHPDLNPGDKAAAATFRELQAAHEILSDDSKRHQYDAGEIDAEGKETARPYYHDFATHDHPYASSAGYEDIGDMFSDLFRAQQQAKHAGSNQRGFPGGDVRYQMDISFCEAATGTKKQIQLPDGKALNLTIPAGHADGHQLRLKGKGMPGLGDGPSGDAYIDVHVRPDRIFKRQDRDILLDINIALNEAVLGGRVQVPTIHGSVTMTLPPGSNTGDTLRLKGKGISGRGRQKDGDQRVRLQVVLPKTSDPSLTEFVKEWATDHAYDPRPSDWGDNHAQ